MQANLPSRGKPVGRSFTFNRRSYLWWIWSQLKCAEARAYECYRMGLPGTGQPPVFLGHRSWFGTWPFPRSALGDLLRPPVIPQTPLMGPDTWEQYWPKKHVEHRGKHSVYLPGRWALMTYMDKEEDQSGWNIYLLCAKCLKSHSLFSLHNFPTGKNYHFHFYPFFHFFSYPFFSIWVSKRLCALGEMYSKAHIIYSDALHKIDT